MGVKLKIPKVVIIAIGVVAAAAIAAGIFFFHSRPEPEQVFRANLTEAQKVLVTLRRAETAFQQGANSYKYLSARKSSREMIYSAGWNAMKLPEVVIETGFDYECLPAEGICQATETANAGPTGNGIRINIETGAFDCLGTYKPVTTHGFDGSEITVGCRAS